MRVRDLLTTGRPVFSFEFYPPKTEEGEQRLVEAVMKLRTLRPGFISVTYGAGGSTRHRTIELVTRFKREHGLEAMAHLACIGHDQAEITHILDRLQESGIENVLCLRGDPPRGETPFVRLPGGFAYAAELVRFARQRGYEFCLGGAGYPEGHPECRDRDESVEHLRQKVAEGLDFVITQLFFDNADYFSFAARCRRAGITAPIVPGIMPITGWAQIERITELCGARIPESLRQQIGAKRDDAEATRAIGVEHGIRQCRELLSGGVPGIHFYTLNHSPATAAILAELRGREWS